MVALPTQKGICRSTLGYSEVNSRINTCVQGCAHSPTEDSTRPSTMLCQAPMLSHEHQEYWLDEFLKASSHSLLRYCLFFNMISKRAKNHFVNIESKKKMLVLQVVDSKLYCKCTMLTLNNQSQSNLQLFL